MILSGRQIQEQIREGKIEIDPFDPKMVGPNSYNLSLFNELMCYTNPGLDMAVRNPTETMIIPREGLLLKPGELYLGRTIEHTRTNDFVPMLEGRSSVGRLGIFVHITAGFGDIGFSGTWTLEITVIKPTRIYANVPICQIYFHTIEGDYDLYKSKKYQGQRQIVSSRMWKDITIIPSSHFFTDLRSSYDSAMKTMIQEDNPGPFLFSIQLSDEEPNPHASRPPGLEDYLYTQSFGEFKIEEIQLFFAEVPSCLKYAIVTLRCTTTGSAAGSYLKVQ